MSLGTQQQQKMSAAVSPANDRVHIVQVIVSGVGDEKLGPNRVGTIVGHGHNAPSVMLGIGIEWGRGEESSHHTGQTSTHGSCMHKAFSIALTFNSG